MQTPPCLESTATVDLTLPANRLRAAARVSQAPRNALAATAAGLAATTTRSIVLTRSDNQDVEAPLVGVAVEWDGAATSVDAWWSTLDPSRFVMVAGVWSVEWYVAAVAADAAQVTGGYDAFGVELVTDAGATIASSVFSEVDAATSTTARFSRYSPGAAGPWLGVGQRLSALAGGDLPVQADSWTGHVLVPDDAVAQLRVTVPFGPGKARIAGSWSGSFATPQEDGPAHFVATWLAPAP